MSKECLATWDGDITSPLRRTLHEPQVEGRKKSLWGLTFLILFPPTSPPQEKEGVEAVSVGAILSDYQRVRVENV